MAVNNYFLVEKMKLMRDDQMIRLLAGFNRGRNISAVDLHQHHQLKFSNDQDDHDDDHSFGSKVNDFDDIGSDWPVENDEQEENRIFWESHEFLLQEILDQCNSNSTKLRDQIRRNINIAIDSNLCDCQDKNLRGLRQAVVNQLCSKGFNAALCTSKWKRTHKIPGGSHEYIEVIASTQGRRKQIPFVVELGFRDEFKMAKACDKYDKLIEQLPEIYIGKFEHLNALIRIVCKAAKKSAKESKIHMGPWRTREFMGMKWSASSESRLLGNSSDELLVSSLRKGSLNGVRSSIKLTMASTVKVA